MSSNLLKSRLFISLILVSAISYPTSLLAQPKEIIIVGDSDKKETPVTKDESRTYFIPWMPRNREKPDGKGTPPADNGTGSRGDCLEKEIPLTRLVGGKNLELTVSEYPTFWFYVPYTSSETPFGEFRLQDREGNDLYKTQFPLPKTPGAIAISLPSTASPLEINYKYRWYLTINCPQPSADAEFSSPAFVTGQVQRVPNLGGELKEAQKPLERIEIYAKNGIWYDALTELAKLHLAEPQDKELVRAIADLLKEVGLEQVSQQRILGNI